MKDGQNGVNIPSLDLRQLKVISALGRGAKGVVFLVKNEFLNGELIALKSVLKASIEKNNKATDKSDGSEYRRIVFEQEVLSCFQHPLLPKLRGVLSTENIVGYAIDYCPGRDLNYLRKKQTEKMFSDDIIRFYAAELVLALEYLHGLSIVYRDLKPENVMIQENGHLMLVDFDLSTKLTKKAYENRSTIKSVPKTEPAKKRRSPSFFKCLNYGISPEDSVHPVEFVDNSVRSKSNSVSKSNSFVGTEEYVAPEMILGTGHDFTVDWWCLGVVLYEMLYGATPFRGSNRKETFYRILSKSPELVGEPTPLRDLIGKLLEKDPSCRISVDEIKSHEFFNGVNWDMILKITRPPFIPSQREEEDIEGNKGIDVESFVQGVFKVDANDDSKNKKNDENPSTQGEKFLMF